MDLSSARWIGGAHVTSYPNRWAQRCGREVPREEISARDRMINGNPTSRKYSGRLRGTMIFTQWASSLFRPKTRLYRRRTRAPCHYEHRQTSPAISHAEDAKLRQRIFETAIIERYRRRELSGVAVDSVGPEQEDLSTRTGATGHRGRVSPHLFGRQSMAGEVRTSRAGRDRRQRKRLRSTRRVEHLSQASQERGLNGVRMIISDACLALPRSHVVQWYTQHLRTSPRPRCGRSRLCSRRSTPAGTLWRHARRLYKD